MNIVLDTNCLIMSISPRSPYRSVWQSFLDCAIVANARCIVSEDKHFNVLKTVAFPKIDVIGINDFMDILGKHLN